MHEFEAQVYNNHNVLIVLSSVGNWFGFSNQSSVWPNQSMIDYILSLWAAIVGNSFSVHLAAAQLFDAITK